MICVALFSGCHAGDQHVSHTAQPDARQAGPSARLFAPLTSFGLSFLTTGETSVILFDIILHCLVHVKIQL